MVRIIIAAALLACVQALQVLQFGGGRAGSITKVIELKAQLTKLTQGTSNGVKATSLVRTEIAGIAGQLEKLNKVKKLTASPLINGNWKLLYTTNDGSSAGKIGPFVGEVSQLVELGRKRYNNEVALGPLKGTLVATWNNLGDKLWKVRFLTLQLSIFGIKFQSSQLTAEGTWRMTYLDENLRILYAKGGKNQNIENIYILSKFR